MLVALAAGALVGAGQLGVAYGLGIVRLARTFDADATNQWNAQLAWVSWFAMLAAITGAVIAARVARRGPHTPGAGTRMLLTLCSGIGACAVIPLSMQPARSADLARSGDPALVVGLAAGLGAVAGVLVAVAVLSLRPLAWNLAAIATTIWLAGLSAVGPYLGPGDPLPTIRLGVPQWTVQAGAADELVGMLAMPVLAWLAGALVAAVARARRESGLATALSGVAGAAPLALAYLIAGPGSSGDTADQMGPYVGALIAVPAGLLGSLLIALLPRRDRARAGGTADAIAGPPDAVEPTNILPPIAEGGRRRQPTDLSSWTDSLRSPDSPVPPQRQPSSGAASVSGVASVPRRDDTADLAGSPASRGQAPQGRKQGGKLPRRTPGQRFHAGT
jgi:hypothetical protein